MTVGRPTPVWPRTRLEPNDLLLVTVGGAGGATVRWAVMTTVIASGGFPWVTLAVNVVGCFVVGLLADASRSSTLLVGVGFAGGLTTFSTFALETATLVDSSDLPTAVAYVGASFVAGILAVVAGRRTVR